MAHTLYDIVTISPANAGFGEYQVSGAHTGEPVDLDDYLAECAADGIQVTETHELDGLIHDQPSRVYAVINDDGTTSYLGANPSDLYESTLTDHAVTYAKAFPDIKVKDT